MRRKKRAIYEKEIDLDREVDRVGTASQWDKDTFDERKNQAPGQRLKPEPLVQDKPVKEKKAERVSRVVPVATGEIKVLAARMDRLEKKMDKIIRLLQHLASVTRE